MRVEASSERTIPDQTTVADYMLHSKHVFSRHPPSYRCQRTECAQLRGFTYSSGLLRHEREVHGLHDGPKDQLRCTVSTCKRHSGERFTRKDNLNEHLRRVHGITTAGGVTSTGHQDSRPSTNKTSSIGNVDAQSEIKHVIERQDTRNNALWGNQIWSWGPTGQRSAILDRMPPDGSHPPQTPARDNDNLAVQTQSLPPRPRSTTQALTPDIRAMTWQPYTPDAQVQPQDSHHTSETSLHAPYTYVNAPHVNHDNQLYADASFSTMSTEDQIQGPPPRPSRSNGTSGWDCFAHQRISSSAVATSQIPHSDEASVWNRFAYRNGVTFQQVILAF